jgi:hypothetical protein
MGYFLSEKDRFRVFHAVQLLNRLVANLSPRMSGSVHVGFVVNKVTLRQDFLRDIQVFLSILFHRGSRYSRNLGN